VDHLPADNQVESLSLISVPANSFSISPSSVTLNKTNWQKGVPIQITCLEESQPGEAFIKKVDGTKLIDFTTRKKAILTAVPSLLNAAVNRSQDGKTEHWKFQLNLVYDGPEEQIINYTFQVRDDAGNLIEKLVITLVNETVDPPQRKPPLLDHKFAQR
jgi:hypothetical protein